MQPPLDSAVARLAELIFIHKVAQDQDTTWDFQPIAKQSFDAAQVFVDYLKHLSSPSQTQIKK